jgi:hypothetical protein
MKYINYICLFSLIVLLFSSCEEFIETDLSKSSLTVIAPLDNATTPNFTQTFWWEELKGADSYQIQIVRPSFSAMQYFVTDTTVHGSRIDLILQPGTYEWRIRAKNSISSTEFITRTLSVDSTLDLSGQTVALSLPSNNHYSKTLANTFSWQTMPNAQYYVLQLLQNGSLIHTQSSNTTTANYTFSTQGIYEWRVFAQNNNSNSGYATRTITIDTAKPVIPVFSLPTTDTITAEPIQLTWTHPESTITFRIQISDDSTFSTVIKDTTLEATTYNLFNIPSGTYYYWHVKAIDRALNESAYFYRRRIKKN